MNRCYFFVRFIFAAVTILCMTGYFVATTDKISSLTYVWAALSGGALFCALMLIEFAFKRFQLVAFNTAILGLFFGFLMSLALLMIFDKILAISSFEFNHKITELIKIALLLGGVYCGVVMTLQASHELYVSLPFIKFTPHQQKSKELLADSSALSDSRIIELATCGLLDNRLVVPRFLLKELYENEESKDEIIQTKAKLTLEILKKLETLPDLHLRYSDTDFNDSKDMTSKILRLARLLNADVLTTDINRVQMASIEEVRVINIHGLSNALKPLMQRGEYLNIKIQRHGKEERQGVGYLEDGTMIVVNGGGDYIGKSIKACVLSVKHTTTGRMIFCNVADESYSLT